eukprot:199136-Prymnesium_polylepis.1
MARTTASSIARRATSYRSAHGASYPARGRVRASAGVHSSQNCGMLYSRTKKPLASAPCATACSTLRSPVECGSSAA